MRVTVGPGFRRDDGIHIVIPAKAGIHSCDHWVPAFAGTTDRRHAEAGIQSPAYQTISTSHCA